MIEFFFKKIILRNYVVLYQHQEMIEFFFKKIILTNLQARTILFMINDMIFMVLKMN